MYLEAEENVRGERSHLTFFFFFAFLFPSQFISTISLQREFTFALLGEICSVTVVQFWYQIDKLVRTGLLSQTLHRYVFDFFSGGADGLRRQRFEAVHRNSTTSRRPGKHNRAQD